MTNSGRRRHCTEARIRASRRDRGHTRSRLLWERGIRLRPWRGYPVRRCSTDAPWGGAV